MPRAPREQGVLHPLPPAFLGPIGSVFQIPKASEKCNLVINLIPANTESRQKRECFFLPMVEGPALLAMAGVLVSNFFLAPATTRSRVYK